MMKSEKLNEYISESYSSLTTVEANMCYFDFARKNTMDSYQGALSCLQCLGPTTDLKKNDSND